MRILLKHLAAALAALTLILVASQPATAQAPAAPTDEQLFHSFLSSPAYGTFLEQALDRTEPAPFKAECARLTLLEQPRFGVVRPARFAVANGQGSIVDGVWVAFMRVDRCGAPGIRRVLIVVSGANNMVPTRMLPGEFRGDLTLEADVQRTVVPVLMEMAECKDEKAVFVGDIKAVNATAEAWTEHWFANACAKPVSILVNYTRRGNAIEYTTDVPVEAGQMPIQPMPAQPVPALPLRPGLPTTPFPPRATPK